MRGAGGVGDAASVSLRPLLRDVAARELRELVGGRERPLRLSVLALRPRSALLAPAARSQRFLLFFLFFFIIFIFFLCFWQRFLCAGGARGGELLVAAAGARVGRARGPVSTRWRQPLCRAACKQRPTAVWQRAGKAPLQRVGLRGQDCAHSGHGSVCADASSELCRLAQNQVRQKPAQLQTAVLSGCRLQFRVCFCLYLFLFQNACFPGVVSLKLMFRSTSVFLNLEHRI